MNGALFNSRLFAGAASAALAVTALASFSAEGHVLTATATHQHAPKAAWDASVEQGLWDSDYQQSTGFSFSLTTGLFADPFVVRAGRTEWTAPLNWFGYSYNEIAAQADFEPTTKIVFVPFAQFSFVDFPNSITWEANATSVWQAKTNWSSTASWGNDGVFAKYAGEVSITGTTPYQLFEPEVTSNGVLTQHGYTFWKSNETGFVEDPTKTQLFVGEFVWREAVQFTGSAIVKHASASHWTGYGNAYLLANLVHSPEGTWASNVALVGEPNYVFRLQEDEVNWTSRSLQNFRPFNNHIVFDLPLVNYSNFELLTNFFSAADTEIKINTSLEINAAQLHQSRETWFANTQGFFVAPGRLSIKATQRANFNEAVVGTWETNDARTPVVTMHWVEGNWPNSSSWFGDGAYAIGASADWRGLGASLSVPAVLRTFLDGEYVFAPDRRTLRVPADNRTFLIINDGRTFYLNERGVTFEV